MSKTKPTKDKRKHIYVPGVLFLGCRKWASSPYLVSLYLLFIRLGKYTWITNDIVNETDHEKLVAKLKKVCKHNKNDSRDASYIHRTLDTGCFLMGNYNELFSNNSAEYNWSTDRLTKRTSVYTEGISKLASFSSGYKELNDKWKKFKKSLKKV